jgi:hypothetical protein
LLARLALAAGAIATPSTAHAAEENAPASVASAAVQDSMCLMIEAAAGAHGVPVPFFTRLIGQESSFRPDAVGPVTRSGQQAQGIAQFMPGTAAERGLLDPFDPVQALPRSAEFLHDLKVQFGNWGLAAAAYNAGPKRVADWIEGKGGLPFETQRYVAAITGRAAEDWRDKGQSEEHAAPVEKGSAAAGDQGSCETVRAALRTGRNLYLAALEKRVTEGVAQPWGVQLSGGFSRARALTTFASAERRFSAILGGADPMILRSLNRSRGTRAFYQVRAGAPTRKEADALCGRIRSAGGACIVLRTAGPGRRPAA